MGPLQLLVTETLRAHFAARGISEHLQLALSAQGGDMSPWPCCDSWCLCLQTAVQHLQPIPLPEREDGVKPPKGKFVLQRI